MEQRLNRMIDLLNEELTTVIEPRAPSYWLMKVVHHTHPRIWVTYQHHTHVVSH
jgi:hypothetical protein